MRLKLLRVLTGRTLVESHRGAEQCGPENSWPAIEAAYQAGADLIEVDVQLSRDHIPFLRHNYTLPDGRWCRSVDWSELAAIKINGEPLPQLADVLDWAYRSKACLSLDMKGGFETGKTLYQEVGMLIQKTQTAGNVLILDWDHHALMQFKQIYPEIAVRALLRGRPINLQELLQAIPADAVSLSYDLICQEDVVKVQKLKIAVALTEMWQADFERVRQLEVDIVSWGNPGEAKQALHAGLD